MHFSLYSIIAFAVSSLAGGHVFYFVDVLRHSLAEDLYICLLIYPAVFIVSLRFIPSEPEIPLKEERVGLTRISIINGTSNILIQASDIIFITASSPYY
ncbi:hypothetical protein [Dyadobacter sp. NIV53]|uniref:hypothetical protein n=1 Tax=Dyadobacter sp. NIV53 TaxID=2861765 RepID=UPI001C86B287|nr:hypothetical protein [Dyadobacter sp. NIV53]